MTPPTDHTSPGPARCATGVPGLLLEGEQLGEIRLYRTPGAALMNPSDSEVQAPPL